ncbi:class I SAM-dependent DNA methyltransferase [Streptomyces erythrochromogenes]|uniref:HsdM family class I SAM-dependent methyltransferase n=1 Tax=Streptomyces erythrochromogenes TaxID=285574 RepID=UPI0036CA86E0
MTDEQQTVDQHLWRLFDSLRGRLSSNELADSLLWNAVDWRTRATGLPAPEVDIMQLAAQRVRKLNPALDPTLEGEQELLQTYTPAQIRRYARTLLRPVHQHDEFATSASLVKVAEATLTSYERGGRTDALHLYDPACGSATLALDVAESLTDQAGVPVSIAGQDVSSSTVQRARAHAYLVGADAAFSLSNSLEEDAFPGRQFDYTVAEIPYNMSWHNSLASCSAEAERLDGRFPAGLPQPNNASLLFAQILLSKLRDPADGGGRGIMFTATGPLSDTGGSAIRTWLLEQDLLDAVVALPEGLSANTSIRLFALVFSNGKPKARRRKVQFIDLRGFYEDVRSRRLERRTISDAALDELSRSLKQPKPTPYSRTASASDLSFRRVSVMHDTTAATGKPGQGHVPSLTILLPVTSSIETWRNARYVTTPPDVSDVANSQLTMFDVDRVFRTDRPPRALRDLTQHGWKTARLTELAQHICYVPSAKAADRPAKLSSASGEPALILPIEPHLDAVTGDPGEVAPDNRILVVQTRDKHADADYLAGWLNSPLGRKLRSAAASSGSDSYVSPRGFNLTQAWRMADDLLIALPDLPVQRDMARTERALGAARRHLVDSHRELWNDPRKRSDIYREASRLIPSADLAQWAATLPFPMASALWAYESKGDSNLHARHAQMFHFWDATIQFHATVLLSGLLQDRSGLEQELPALAAQFSKVGLSPERASLGVWHIVLQRLTKRYRTAVTGTDTDEQARVRATFADAPPDFMDTLLSTDVTNLFGEVIHLRNTWSGHSGATSEDSLREQLGILTGHVHTLRNLIGAGWLDFPLVRAGGARIRNGVFHHEVDLAVGPNTPFKQEQFPSNLALEEDGLYLVSREGGGALPLAPLVKLQPAAFGANSDCYYYNRLQTNGMRFVAYHEAAKSETLTAAVPTAALVAALASGVPASQ